METSNFYNTIVKSLQESTKLSLISSFKTNDPLFDTIISTILITCGSYLVNIFYIRQNPDFINFNFVNFIKSLFFKKNTIILEGKKSSVVTKYNSSLVNTSSFTDNFKAVLNDIISNIKDNPSVYEIKEFFIKNSFDEDVNNTDFDGYVISQKKIFLYNKELQIYAFTEIIKQETERDKKSTAIIDTITIHLYSYVTSLGQMHEYINQLTKIYLKKIETSRLNKRFIYTLQTRKNDDESRLNCWKEHIFESTRTFDNIFFEGKNEVVEKINFFLSNSAWYFEMGIPYTLGFGLHGPPGTGKTSFFKCLANLTGRHVVVLSLKLIKTKSQLDEFFFENRYNYKNRENSIGFDKKIIVIEDIDCLGDIVLKRTLESSQKKQIETKSPVEEAVKLFVEHTDDKNKMMESLIKSTTTEEPITLDDILNLWDGLKETPGRILGISSNHYDKLDPALIRPGRIDITLNFDNASRDIIQQMHRHFYKTGIDPDKLKKIRNKFYSPAEIINYYIMFKNDSDKFVESLIKGKKL